MYSALAWRAGLATEERCGARGSGPVVENSSICVKPSDKRASSRRGVCWLQRKAKLWKERDLEAWTANILLCCKFLPQGFPPSNQALKELASGKRRTGPAK